MVSITCFRQVCEILQGLFFLPPPLMGKIWGTMILMIVLQDIIWLFCKKYVGWSRIVLQKRFWLVCKNYFIVLREILTIVLQEISGFEIFSAQLLLAFPTFLLPQNWFCSLQSFLPGEVSNHLQYLAKYLRFIMVSKYTHTALLCGEKMNQKFPLWRKMTHVRYELVRFRRIHFGSW